MFLYAIRKRSKTLGRIGKSRNWLDIHIVLGIAAPALITLHSSFRMQGLAGIAYWIMISVVLSGFVGRYLYAQIPRSITAAEMTLKEMQLLMDEVSRELEQQRMFSAEDLAPVLAAPDREAVDAMSIGAAVLLMLQIRSATPVAYRKATLPSNVGPSRDSYSWRIVAVARTPAWKRSSKSLGGDHGWRRRSRFSVRASKYSIYGTSSIVRSAIRLQCLRACTSWWSF